MRAHRSTVPRGIGKCKPRLTLVTRIFVDHIRERKMAGNHWIHVSRRILRVPLNVPRPVVLFGVSRLKIVSTETADEAK